MSVARGVIEQTRQKLFEASRADVDVPAQNAHAGDVAWPGNARFEHRPADAVAPQIQR